MMIIKILRGVKHLLVNALTTVLIWQKRRNEIKKFKNKKRVEIYSKVSLTKEQKEKIDMLYKSNYGKRIPYTWHRHFTAFTGNFDEKYFPELLYIPEFEHFMNQNVEYAKVFSDKNMLPLLAQSVGVKMPKTLLSATRGAYRDSSYRILSDEEALKAFSNLGEMFIKPSIDSCSGQGCGIVRMEKGCDAISKKSAKEILEGLGTDFCVQERLKCHESISNIYSGSVNTFRVITYRWKNEICVMPSIMRIGQGGGFLDNAHAGGMFIAVDKDGSLHEKAFTEFKNEFVVHPDSNITFKGYKIDLFPKVVDAAKKMHEAIPQLGVVNWDFTIDETGEPVLIEGNMLGGSVWLVEMAHGKGAFEEKTEEILEWLKFMKKLPSHKRKNYLFGNIKGYVK